MTGKQIGHQCNCAAGGKIGEAFAQRHGVEDRHPGVRQKGGELAVVRMGVDPKEGSRMVTDMRPDDRHGVGVAFGHDRPYDMAAPERPAERERDQLVPLEKPVA